MIPKIIHYCWFGKNEKSKEIKDNIADWKRKLPEYKFIEWNENNFDIEEYQYAKEAYISKKFAFVSDVARIKALKKYGGIYLDTDIEIKKDFSDLLEKYKLILGYENSGKQIMTAFIAAEKNSKYINEFLDLYENEKFILEDKSFNVYPNTYRLTKYLENNKIIINGQFYHNIENGIAIFPEKYFSAMQFSTMNDISDIDTYTVHHFNSSWKPWYIRLRRKIKITICKSIRILFKRKE